MRARGAHGRACVSIARFPVGHEKRNTRLTLQIPSVAQGREVEPLHMQAARLEAVPQR